MKNLPFFGGGGGGGGGRLDLSFLVTEGLTSIYFKVAHETGPGFGRGTGAESIYLKLIRFHPLPLSKRWRNVYFANENVHFHQLHHESEMRLPKDCFLTFWSMIRFIFCLPSYLVLMLPAYMLFWRKMPNCKIYKALPVSAQILALFLYNIKHIQV